MHADIVIGIVAVFAIIAGDAAISMVEATLHLAVKPQIAALFTTPFWYRAFIAVRAGIVEETAFRGYGFERIAGLTGSKWLAAAVTFVLFSAAHYQGGGLALLLVAAWGGFVLTAALSVAAQSLDDHPHALADGHCWASCSCRC